MTLAQARKHYEYTLARFDEADRDDRGWRRVAMERAREKLEEAGGIVYRGYLIEPNPYGQAQFKDRWQWSPVEEDGDTPYRYEDSPNECKAAIDDLIEEQVSEMFRKSVEAIKGDKP